jgi:hypothetical protein
MRHDRDAENEGLKTAYMAIAPVWPGVQPHDNSAPALPEPTPQPCPEPDHPKAAFYRPGPSPCFNGAAWTAVLCRQLRPRAVICEGRLVTDDDSYQLAVRLAGHAASTALQDQPQIQRDLLSASRQVADFRALLDAWEAVFAQQDIGQEFAEMLGTAGMNEAWKRRLQFKVISREIPDALNVLAVRKRISRQKGSPAVPSAY